MLIAYSVNLNAKIPKLLNQSSNSRVRQTILNASKANIYGVNLTEVPFLKKNIQKYARQYKSKHSKRKGIAKILNTLRKANRSSSSAMSKSKAM